MAGVLGNLLGGGGTGDVLGGFSSKFMVSRPSEHFSPQTYFHPILFTLHHLIENFPTINSERISVRSNYFNFRGRLPAKKNECLHADVRARRALEKTGKYCN